MLRVLSALTSAALVAAGLLIWLTASSAGFPDGHLTEVERVMAPLLQTATWITTLCGAALLATTTRRPEWLRRWHPVAAIAFLALLFIAHGQYTAYLKTFLNSGQGG